MRHDGVERFDVLPLLVATDGAIAAFGHDHRRLRPNIVISGVDGLAEREWPGGCLRIGKVLIGVQDLRLRCIMTAYDPDTLVRDKDITRDIYRRFAGKLALNCFVIEGGELTVGDEVQLVRGRACAESAAAIVSPFAMLLSAAYGESHRECASQRRVRASDLSAIRRVARPDRKRIGFGGSRRGGRAGFGRGGAGAVFPWDQVFK